MNESEAFIMQLCGTKFHLLQACLRGGKGAHFENYTAILDELGVKLLGEKKFYPIQQKSTVFNQ